MWCHQGNSEVNSTEKDEQSNRQIVREPAAEETDVD